MDKVDYERITQDQNARANAPRPSGTYHRLLKLAGFLGIALLAHHFWSTGFPRNCFRGWLGEATAGLDDLCPQVDPLTCPEHEGLLRNLDSEFDSSEFRLKLYESLGGAIRIPTENYDDLGPPLEDPRWENLTKLHDYLEAQFPKVHANLKRTKVNTYGLVYEWKGTQNSKPLMFTAHMDVVPANPDTLDQWVHPPYSGYYDGEWIWGRGSGDFKAGVIGTLIVIETLLEHNFVPSRTVLLAFGFDEESGGRHGAAEISKYFLKTYGPDSMAMIVDEGKSFRVRDGVVFALPGVAEKGFMNIRMDVSTPGGHSSAPPKHTGIGILADLITELEARSDKPELIRGKTYYQSLECRAKYDTGFPESLTKLLLESQTSDEKLKELGDRLNDFDPRYGNNLATTRAVDLVGGGVKVNALPEVAWAVANHRIADYSSPAELTNRFTDITLAVAAKHNMTVESFGEAVGPMGPSWGTIRLSDFNNETYGPAPVTPTTGSGPYELLSGTIRSSIQTHLRTDNLPNSVIVSPGILSATTDTKHYWDLTQHIFRYNHFDADDHRGLHTINEALRAEAFLEQIRFFARLILNADQSDLLE